MIKNIGRMFFLGMVCTSVFVCAMENPGSLASMSNGEAVAISESNSSAGSATLRGDYPLHREHEVTSIDELTASIRGGHLLFREKEQRAVAGLAGFSHWALNRRFTDPR